MSVLIELAERGILPDGLIRWGIRDLDRRRLKLEDCGDLECRLEAKQAFIRSLRQSPIAIETDAANRQHYEVPAAFFTQVLGRRVKYSGALWPEGTTGLDAAEEAMLQLTCERAQVEDGMQVLDLGCGWGSLSLWLAEHYPACRVLAVSNSALQRQHIEGVCARRGHDNVTVVTADATTFAPTERFDRILSVEMFEHMRNHEALLRRIAGWLALDGKLFVHVFCHRQAAYAFETDGTSNWLGRHFFIGGMMPSDDLPLHFQDHLQIVRQWRWDGRHYEKTANAWLQNMDRMKPVLFPLFQKTYGQDIAGQWWMRWRMFFMACAELFGYEDGQQWWVSHYLFEKRKSV